MYLKPTKSDEHLFRKFRREFIFINVAIHTGIMVLALSIISYRVWQKIAVNPELGEILPPIYLACIVIWLMIVCLSGLFSKSALAPIIKAWHQQRSFLTAASHELKTPLEIINSNLEVVLLNPTAQVSSQKKWLRNIGEGSNRLNLIIEKLLTVAKLNYYEPQYEPQAVQAKKKTFDLTKMINHLWQQLIHQAQAKQITLHTNLPPQCPITTNRSVLDQLLLILLENALKYTNRGGQINVIVKKTTRHWQLTITNTGAGIDPQVLPYIFDYFYRPTPTTNTNTAGMGLGLAIARLLANGLAGKLTVDSKLGSWTKFTLTLPR